MFFLEQLGRVLLGAASGTYVCLGDLVVQMLGGEAMSSAAVSAQLACEELSIFARAP